MTLKNIIRYPLSTLSYKQNVLALQLFDEDNPLHKSDNKYIFTTEGHVVPIDKRFREKQWNDLFPCEEGVLAGRRPNNQPQPSNISNVRLSPSHCSPLSVSYVICIIIKCLKKYLLSSFSPHSAVQQDPGGATVRSAIKERLHEAD